MVRVRRILETRILFFIHNGVDIYSSFCLQDLKTHECGSVEDVEKEHGIEML
jgi:hypothetical protein